MRTRANAKNSHISDVIAEIGFENFKALRATRVRLEAFNLIIGPNGSGKTSLIEALLRLRTLAALTPQVGSPATSTSGARITFNFRPPAENIRVTLGCRADGLICDSLWVEHGVDEEGAAQWEVLRKRLRGVRAHLFDHHAMAQPVRREDGAVLSSNAGNLAAVFAGWQQHAPEAMAGLEVEFCRLLTEYTGLSCREVGGGRVELVARLRDGAQVAAADLSQGTLYLLAVLALAFDPAAPSVLCIEEVDRGLHPHMLRAVRDTLYRLSHPESAGLSRVPTQVLATTHSPYLLDHYRDHPEEVVLATKRGTAATFERLSERADLMDLARENHLGDLWYSGVLGGVPEEA